MDQSFHLLLNNSELSNEDPAGKNQAFGDRKICILETG